MILADPTCSAARDTPSRHVDSARRLWLEPLCGSAPVELLEAAAEELQREQEEAVRVAYVAATRARDLLVAPGLRRSEDRRLALGARSGAVPAACRAQDLLTLLRVARNSGRIRY